MMRRSLVLLLVLGLPLVASAAKTPALDQLPYVEVASFDQNGLPSFLAGDLGVVAPGPAATSAPAYVKRLATMAGLRGEMDLRVIEARSDDLGQTHVRMLQQHAGMPIVGADMVLHLREATGEVLAFNGRMVPTDGLPTEPELDGLKAIGWALEDAGIEATILGEARLAYVVDSAGAVHLAWSAMASYESVQGPELDEVFADALTGALAARHPHIYHSKYRKIYTANNGTSLPGTLLFNEGGSSSDGTAMDAYNHSGYTYDYYKNKFNRDSYDNNGATLKSTVHYSSNYNNAYWNGSQMVYGDGDGSSFSPLAGALDVCAHELTHAVTERTANLVYEKEPGALNEAFSDILGASTEAWKDGGVSSATWKIGEDIYTPGTSGDALRYMNNPTADGYSKDYYPERLYSGSCTPNPNTNDNCGVHGNSGIANLAYKLLVTGGTHPRGKTSVNVPGIGISKAEQIFYRALTVYMTSSTNFEGARNATAQAADDLYGQSTVDAVQATWNAVGVPGGPVSVTTLSNGVPIGGLSGSKGAEDYFTMAVPSGASNLVFQISGGSGDADLYVRRGSMPTTSSYDCRPYRNGNSETCSFSSPGSGDWYVMLRAYASYSNVTLEGSYDTGTPNQPPNAAFTFTTSDLTASFTDTSSDSDGSISAWSWSFGDGHSSSSRNPSHTYSSGGTYTVTLTVTDNDGATDNVSHSVTVTEPPGGGAPCTGCTEYTGTLSGSGDYDYQPNGTYYHSYSSGVHEGWLEGPSGTDFDLYLYKWSGSRWKRVASSTSSSSSEHIAYSGSSGYYYWKVKSYSGSGSYQLWLDTP